MILNLKLQLVRVISLWFDTISRFVPFSLKTMSGLCRNNSPRPCPAKPCAKPGTYKKKTNCTITSTKTNHSVAKRVVLILLAGLLTIEQPTEAFSAGMAAGGIIGGFAAFLVLGHYIHARHDKARGEHDLDIDTEYGPAAKRYMHAKVMAQREHHNRHSKHHREQHAHREKSQMRQNRAYTEL